MKRGFLVAALACAAVGCSGPYSSPTVSAKTEGSVSRVRVETAALRSIPEVVTATGELVAEENAVVSARIAGRIGEVKVDLGSLVDRDDVVALIEPVEYEYRARGAEALVEQTRARLGLKKDAPDTVNPAETATVKQAAAALEEARLNFARISQLYKAGVLSRMEFDRGQAAVQQTEARHQEAIEGVLEAQAQLSERRVALGIAKYQLSETFVRAPFRGAVTKRIAAVGEQVTANSAVVTVARLHPIRLRLEVPERYASRVRAGQRVDVRITGMAPRSGKIVRLSPTIETQNRILTIEAEIPNEDGALRPGSFADGAITVDPHARGYSVPASAVAGFAGVDRIFIVENGALAERIVKPGRTLNGGRVEILSGLAGGERVVTEATDRLTVGQKAAPVEP
jgi:RND family efflux transporter MFP subunit